jgi:NADH-quinone oxidoreductase subunit L
MGLAVVIAVAGIFLAVQLLKPAELLTPDNSPAEKGFAKLLLEKYRVDELYDAAIIRPLLSLSRVVLWKGIDAGVIDTAGVNGSAALVRGLGWIGSRLQTGQVGTYVVVFVIGALAVLVALMRMI